MKGQASRTRRYGFLLAGLVLLIGLSAGIRKAFLYAAPSVRGKDCDFIYPPPEAGPASHVLSLGAVPARPRFGQVGGFINDASCLNKTPVYGIVHVGSEQDIADALAFARDKGLKVTAAGERHSMGGQSFSPDGLVLDMRGLDHIQVDAAHRLMRVQAGATWAAIQQALDRQGLSVKAMQSINIFTVGGTLSVNAHGIAHDPGPVAPTVRSLRIMLADGTVVTASPTENADLFRHVLGGYGLFGVILDADIEITQNEAYAFDTTYMGYKEFPRFFRDKVAGRDDVGLFYGRLSIAPGSYLVEAAAHVYTRVSAPPLLPPLETRPEEWFPRLIVNLSKTGGMGRSLRWSLEKRFWSSAHDCISRNNAMTPPEPCLVTRNQEMYDSMGYLRNRLDDTDILQEYFIPQERMPEFTDGLRRVMSRDGANLLNVTIRGVRQDTLTALPYAQQDMFAFVLYFNQGLDTNDSEILRRTTSDLIDLSGDLGGTFYLPYQLYYSPAQLRRAYPGIDAFFAAKRRYDPTGLFQNKFYQKYGG